MISFFIFACFASLAEIFSSSRRLAFVCPRAMRFRLAFAVDATGKVVNVGSTGYGSLISYEPVHCICQCHVLRVYEPLPAMHAAEAKAASFSAAANLSSAAMRAAALKAKGSRNFAMRGLSLPTYLTDHASLKLRRRPAGHCSHRPLCCCWDAQGWIAVVCW